MKKFGFFVALLLLFLCVCFSACSIGKEKVIIYTSAEDYRVEHMWQRIEEEFPEYNIIIEYMTTGNHAAKLLAEGENSLCDITYDLEYTYLQKIADEGILEDLSDYDYSVFCDDVNLSQYYMAEYRNGGAVIINRSGLEQKGLDIPESYEDLLDPKYKGFISMPDPSSSGTGYMFLLAMVNKMGEGKAFEYFDKLSENIFQFTTSGSGPVNALVQGEALIALGSTGTAVNAINNGAEIEIIYYEGGSPYSLYGVGIIKGKNEREAVRKVFDFLYETYGYENCGLFFPEKIYKDKDFYVENYPTGISYCDMSMDTAERKEYLLSKWKH